MATFTQRTEAPSSSNAYYYSDNPFYQSGYGLPNCTCYAFGRFWEIKGGSRPSLSWGNAEDWYGHTSDGYQRGTEPKLGAILCWRKGAAGNNADGAGHVEVVEAINDDGTIVTSGSAYNGYLFRRKTRTRDGNWSGGDYIFQGFIYNPAVFDGSTSGGIPEGADPNAAYVWAYFLGKLGNKYGVAGLMGNLEAESGMHPDRVQGDIPYSDYSKNYTAKVDNGTISEYNFVHNGPNGGGYGLAQWTYYTRKQALYNMYKSGGYSSIGSIELACDYLWSELQGSPSILNVLMNASSIREASDKILHDFEAPADQSESVEEQRESYGQHYYDLFKDWDGTTTKKKRHIMSKLLLLATILDDF